MPDTKTLAGTGRLTTANSDFGTVEYRLRIWNNDSGWRLGDGRLSADDPGVITGAHNSREQLFLLLESGERLPIMLTHGFGGQFVVSGQVPGGVG